MDFHFVIPRFINHFNENFYTKFRSKLVKFCNFETPSPNFTAPSASIPFPLINLKIQFCYYKI